MTGILEYYLGTFVPAYQNNDASRIIIKDLIEASHNCSPIVLRYSDTQQFEMEVAGAILVNFCKNYAQTPEFPKNALMAVTSILQKASREGNVQRTLMLHLTKITNDVNMAAYYFQRIDKMRIKSVLSDDEMAWKSLAYKVIRHEKIQGLVKESIREFDLSIPDDLPLENVTVTLFENVSPILRGFSGFEDVFINADHFRRKFDSFDGNVDQLQLLAKMDIISVTLHEISHVMIRKCTENLNMSTLALAQMKGLPPNRYEFGKYNEIRVFNMQVDWLLSCETIDMSYVERFITSVENGQMLPAGFLEGAVRRRESIGFGLDIQMPFYLC